MNYQQLYNYFYSVGKSAALNKIADPYDINKRRELIEKAMPQADSAIMDQMVNNPNLTDENINSMYTRTTGESPDMLNQNLVSRLMSGTSSGSAKPAKYDINKRRELIEKAMPQADSAIRDQLINDPNLTDENINSMYTRATGESPDMLNQNLVSRLMSGTSSEKMRFENANKPVPYESPASNKPAQPSARLVQTNSQQSSPSPSPSPSPRPRPRLRPRLDSNGFTPQQAKTYQLYQQGRVADSAIPSSMKAQISKLQSSKQTPQQLLASRGYNRPSQQNLQAVVGNSSYNPSVGFNMNSPIPNSSPSAPKMQAVQAPKVQQPATTSTNAGSRMPSVTAPNMQKSPLQLGNSNFKSMGSGNTSTKA